MKAEWVGGQPLLTDRALFVGYYLNELLINLLPRDDSHERLFAVYGETLQALAQGVAESDLRRFEKMLLQELGYGLTLEHDRDGRSIDSQRVYRYEIEHGATPLAEGESASFTVRGKTLLDMAADDFSDPASAAQSKQLMRTLMHYYLGGRPMETRKIFMELQEL
jgi:DNA repair protein RecO (recombination protein O)